MTVLSSDFVLTALKSVRLMGWILFRMVQGRGFDGLHRGR